MRVKSQDLVGQIINGILITGCKRNKSNRLVFECLCSCGKQFSSRASHIKTAHTTSCGCKSCIVRLPGDNAVINLIYRDYQKSAKRRNLSFSLSVDEFKTLIFGSCVYCGQAPTLSKFFSNQKDRKERSIYCNGIDRSDNTIGYELKNCVSCCSVCNLAKHAMSLADFKSWIVRLVNFHKKKKL